MRSLIISLTILLSIPVFASEVDIGEIVDLHVMPKYQLLAEETAALATVTASDCQPESLDLRAAYHRAFDAWVRVSHLRFGPSERDDRAFALAFWPDTRGATPKTLASLFHHKDPVVYSAAEFPGVSVAARGFHALEFLLYDQQYNQMEAAQADYRCALIRAISRDMALNASAILDEWEGEYYHLISNQGNQTYRTTTEATRQFFTALSLGLEFTSDTRLGRPMGSFDKPRPKRAEARRSGRSLRHVLLSLESTQELAVFLSNGDESLQQDFAATIRRAKELDDPIFAGVSEPQGRFRIEDLQQEIYALRRRLSEEIGPRLGIAAGFNSLDGD